MKKNKHQIQFLSFLITIALLSSAGAVSAQESAYADLDACTKGEQIKLTAKGALTGALAGFGVAFLSGKKDDAAKAAVLGAAVGGAAGFATAYYNAIGTCYKLNPTWVPESNIVRDPSKSYVQVKKENNYKPKEEGIKVLAKKMDMATSVTAGAKLDINSTFDVMTPDGAETAIVVERKLFAVEGDKETAVFFPGRPSDHRTMEPGRNNDIVKLQIPMDAKVGSVYRVEFSVAAEGKTPTVISKTVTVG